jgi:beta-mannosidase
VELSGLWRAEHADEGLRRSFHLRGFDDAGWPELEVPGHWSDCDELTDATEVLYRRSFSSAEATDGPDTTSAGRAWLELDGLFTQGDVWLDGNYLGDTDGYFIHHAFEVTEAIRDGADHVVAVEVTCNPAGADRRRRALMGVFEGGNAVLPESRPGGIWAPVRIRHTGPVRIDRLRAVCTSATAASATVAIRTVLNSATRRTVTLRTEVAGVDHELEQSLAEGVNTVEWTVTIPEPDLWWPRALGDQPLADLTVSVETRQGEVSDHTARRIGLRSLSMRRWRLEVNGERLFVKGANLAPTRPLLAQVTDEAIDAQLDLACDAGLDLVRPYVHVADPRFYTRCDERGLLVWQDLPLQGHAATGMRPHAVAGATAMVDQLGHHPSIVTWNAHVSPAIEWMASGVTTTRTRLARVVEHQLPTPTKSVLDRWVKTAFERSDGTRHVSGFTGVLPHLPRLEGTATHLWFGWRRGSERDLAEFAARWPSQVRFVAEFGAQSVPDTDVVDTGAWPAIARSALEAVGAEAASFDRYVPVVGHDTYDEWRQATQAYQAGLLRRQIESLRRLADRPCGGFCIHMLDDTAPVIGFGTVDHTGQAKPAYRAVIEACRPVIVVADRLPATLRPGDAVAADIHVVSDLRAPIDGSVVDASLSWPGGSHRWRFGGAVAGNDVTRVGTISWIVPDAPGLVTLTLTMRGPVEAVNRYDATIRS